jgi:hypothetical protein
MTLGRNLPTGFKTLIFVVPGLLFCASVRFMNRGLEEMMSAKNPTRAAAYATES